MNPSTSTLTAENAALKARVSKLEAESPETNPVIRKKMEAGLTREQAQAAVQNQAAFTQRFAKRLTAPQSDHE